MYIKCTTFILAMFLIVIVVKGAPAPETPKSSVTVGCLSLQHNEEFRHRVFTRMAASDHTTIWLHRGEALSIDFNLFEEADADVVNVRYSNDGESDDIYLTIDGIPIGSFTTKAHTDWGYLWNVFEDSGPIGQRRTLSPGRHTLSLHIRDSDKYGVEIDYIRLELHGKPGQDESKNVSRFICVHRSSELFGTDPASPRRPRPRQFHG